MVLILEIVTIAIVGESVFKLFCFLLRTFQILTCEGRIKHQMPLKILHFYQALSTSELSHGFF